MNLDIDLSKLGPMLINHERGVVRCSQIVSREQAVRVFLQNQCLISVVIPTITELYDIYIFCLRLNFIRMKIVHVSPFFEREMLLELLSFLLYSYNSNLQVLIVISISLNFF